MPLNQTLIVRPHYADGADITRYGAAFFGQIIDAARGVGLPVIDLFKDDATATNFFSNLEGYDPALINLFGHGHYNLITCQNDETLLQGGVNTNVLAGRVVFDLSCMAGRDLADFAVSEGCPGFLGYDESFYVVMDTRVPVGQELRDEVARGFLESHNAAPIAYIRGAGIAGSYYASYRSFNSWIRVWEAIDSNVAAFLVWNRDHQVMKTPAGPIAPPAPTPAIFPLLLAFAPLALIPLIKKG